MRRLSVVLLVSTAAAAAECPVDQDTFEQVRAAADTGQADAQFALGVHYFKGDCIGADLSQSTRWFNRAADQGHGPAAFNLGNAYHHGRGVDQDTDRSHYWWRRAAFTGLPNAAYNLGVWYLKNHRSQAHRELGVAWLRLAARANWQDAQRLLARLPIIEDGSSPRDWAREPLRSEAELLTRAPTSFVLQLFSGDSKASARRFVDQLELGDSAVVFRLPIDGKVRWNVAFGSYSSRLAANGVLRTLRPDLAKYQPWPRRVGKLQKTVIGVWRRQEQTPLAESW